MDSNIRKTMEASTMQEDDNLESKKRKITENSIQRRLRGPTIKTYPSGPNKDVHLSHPIVLETPKLSSQLLPQKDIDKDIDIKASSTNNNEGWKRRQGKFVLATPESEPDYMWLPFFGTLLTFVIYSLCFQNIQ